jgi:hypothetical protein
LDDGDEAPEVIHTAKKAKVVVEPVATVGAISVASAAEDAKARNNLIKNISTNMKAHLFHLLFEACSKGK